MAQLGLNCKLYRGAAGTTADTLMVNVKDVTINLSTGSADVTTRAAQGWRSKAATLKEGTVTFQMIYSTGDADFTALQSAWLSGGALALYIGNGDGNGLDADFVFTGFNVNQALEDGVTVDVTAEPTYLTRAPVMLSGTGPDAGN